MGPEGAGQGVAAIRRLARQALVEDAGERVVVGAPVDCLALDLFGRDVVDRADELAGLVTPLSEAACLVRPKSER